MTRHPLTLLVSATAVAVLAGCASPSATTSRSTAAPAPAPAPVVAAPAAPATPPAGAAAGVDGGGTRSTALAPTPAPPPAPAAPAMPENASVYFDFDDAAMKQADLAVIERYGRFLNAMPNAMARVEGHADERGSSEYNLALGQRRAQAVVDALKVLGVPERRVEAVSYGEERPRAQGSNEQAWSQNRRADLAVKR